MKIRIRIYKYVKQKIHIARPPLEYESKQIFETTTSTHIHTHVRPNAEHTISRFKVSLSITLYQKWIEPQLYTIKQYSLSDTIHLIVMHFWFEPNNKHTKYGVRCTLCVTYCILLYLLNINYCHYLYVCILDRRNKYWWTHKKGNQMEMLFQWLISIVVVSSSYFWAGRTEFYRKHMFLCALHKLKRYTETHSLHTTVSFHLVSNR